MGDIPPIALSDGKMSGPTASYLTSALRTIIEKFGGGPVGVNTIAAAISEDKDAIEDIYEPFLIQIGFLDRADERAPGMDFKHTGLRKGRKALQIVDDQPFIVADRIAHAAHRIA